MSRRPAEFRLPGATGTTTVAAAFMPALPRFLCFALAVAFAGLAGARAQSLLPPERVSLETVVAFQPLSANWRLAGGLAGDPRTEKNLVAADGTGVLVCNPSKDAHGHLLTAWEHGDLEIDLDFLLPPGANSGVYLQGRYEVQLFDSWGVREPKSSDCGGIYERWDPARGAGKEGYEGHAPKANAARAPGLWQHLHIEFEAPRFDASGKKSANARFLKVTLNGLVVQENVEVTGPTRSAAFADEKPTGPLMIQGDHASVAVRAIAVKRGNPERVGTQDLHYKLYAGDFKAVGDYDAQRPTAEGVPASFAHTAVEKTGKFALVFTGTMNAPRVGTYAFAVESASVARLLVDGRAVVVPLEKGNQPGQITLAAGAHSFRLDLLHQSNNRPALELVAEGSGISAHTLTARAAQRPADVAAGGRGRPRQLLVEPKDRVLVQRGFVPFDPKKHLYTASIGSPAGVHYAYDFETGALLRAWRGSFLDTFEMWDGRGENQLAKPVGATLTLNGKPTVALIEFAQIGDWPDQAEALWSSQGYTLEPDGQPVFLAKLADIAVRDRIAAAPEGRGLARRLEFKGSLPSWSVWVLLAEGETITPQPGGGGWIIGDRAWYLDWPANAPQLPVVRTRHDHAQLAVPLTSATLDKPLTYSIVW